MAGGSSDNRAPWTPSAPVEGAAQALLVHGCDFIGHSDEWWGVHSDPGPPVFHLIECPLTVSNLWLLVVPNYAKAPQPTSAAWTAIQSGWSRCLFNSSPWPWNSFDTSELGGSWPGHQVPLWFLTVPHLSRRPLQGYGTGNFFPTFMKDFFNEDISYATLSKP